MKKLYTVFCLLSLSTGVRLYSQTNINVVFHVVYNTAGQNIADSCLQQQLDVLNEDYNAANADLWKVPTAWVPIIGNMNVHFQLATTDPSGNATTGIERRQYPAISWSTNDNVKHYASGGLNAWPDTSYLNIWVCNLSGGLLGYTQFPGGAAATDGVVLHYHNVGRGTYAQSPYNLGRVGTHEVAHYFGLRHMGPDPGCADVDNIPDTPPFSASLYGGYAPFQVVTDACNPSAPGVMWMNFMSYTDDSSMYFFTQNQVDTMTWVMQHMRMGNSTTTGIAICYAKPVLNIFPSPSADGIFTMSGLAEKTYDVKIYNAAGALVGEIPATAAAGTNYRLDLSFLREGIYLVVLRSDEGELSQRIAIAR